MARIPKDQERLRDAKIVAYMKAHPDLKQIDYAKQFGLSQSAMVRIMRNAGLSRGKGNPLLRNPVWVAQTKVIVQMLHDCPHLSYQEIADWLGVTRDRVNDVRYRLPDQFARRSGHRKGFPMHEDTRKALRKGFHRWLRGEQERKAMSRKIIDIYEPRTITVELNSSKIRQIHQSVYSTHERLGTPEAEAFLFLYKEKLEDGINGYIRDFIKKALG